MRCIYPSVHTLLVVVSCLAAVTLPAQAPAGEASQPDACLFATAYTNATGTWLPYDPWQDNTIGSAYLGQTAPAQTTALHAVQIDAVVETNTKFVLGFDAFPIYENSPASAWNDFGPYFEVPITLDPALDYVPEAPQYLHVDPTFMWETLGGMPGDLTKWFALGPESDTPQAGQNGIAYLSVHPGGDAWAWAQSALQSRLNATPPPGLGAPVAINVVLQLGVLHGNGATGAPEVNLSNAIGLTITPAPAIMVDFLWDVTGYPPYAYRFHCTGMSPSIEVTFPGSNGPITVPGVPTSGNTFSATVPEGAVTGPFGFTAKGYDGVSTASNEIMFIR